MYTDYARVSYRRTRARAHVIGAGCGVPFGRPAHTARAARNRFSTPRSVRSFASSSVRAPSSVRSRHRLSVRPSVSRVARRRNRVDSSIRGEKTTSYSIGFASAVFFFFARYRIDKTVYCIFFFFTPAREFFGSGIDSSAAAAAATFPHGRRRMICL